MSMRPVPEMYPVTQTFRANATIYNYGAGHGALDFGAPMGTPVVAPESGVVVFADWVWNLPGGPGDWASRWYQIKPPVNVRNVGGGILTVIRDRDGDHWVLAHLSSNNEAPAGTRVVKGQVIGKTGNTGSSTGPHLHVSLIKSPPIWNNGYFGAVDPARFLTERYQTKVFVSWKGSSTAGKGSAAKPVKPAKPTNTLPQTYKLDVATTPYYTPAAQVRSVFKQDRKVKSVTIHWWNTPEKAGTHDQTVSYLRSTRPPAEQSSAHFVVSPGRVTQVVHPKDAAWHAGNAVGNATSIGIELSPHDVDGSLATAAGLIRNLEKTYGQLKVVRHRDWSATDCPGAYANKINELVELVNAGAPATVKQKEWDEMATKQEIEEAMERVVTRVMKGEGARQMRGSIKHMLSPGTDDGKGVLSGIFAFAGDRGIKPRGGVVTGNMTVREDEEWGRHFRATTASNIKTLEDNQKRLESKLDALATLLVNTGQLSATKKENA